MLGLAVGPGDRVYALAKSSVLAFQASGIPASGWPFTLPYEFQSPAVTVDPETGVVYARTGEYPFFSSIPAPLAITAVNPDGTQKWQTGLESRGVNGVVLGPDSNVYTLLESPSAGAQRIVALNRDTGAQVCNAGTDISGSLIGAGSSAYLSSGAEIRSVGAACEVAPVFRSTRGNISYLGSDQGNLVSADFPPPAFPVNIFNEQKLFGVAPDGAFRWRNEQAFPYFQPRVIKGGVAYFTSIDFRDNKQKLYMLGTAQGEIIDTLDTTGLCSNCGVAVSDDGTVYLSDLSSTKIYRIIRGASPPAEPSWTQKLPASSPKERSYHSMAYDNARGQIVLFGGMSPNRDLRSDTWVWDGSNWTEKTPTNGPAARYSSALAYDAARGQVVLFGGTNDATFFDDTWVWDGTTWTKKFPANKPSGRSDHSMAYDAARGQVVLFGGFNGSSFLNDTWVWNGIDWVRQSPTNVPTGRAGGQFMTYDASRSQVILAGGYITLDDTWVWDGSDWLEKLPATRPPKRWYGAIAYEAAHAQVVNFGGYLAPGSHDDTWVWDGSDWIQKLPAISPPARQGHAMAYDAAHSQVVLFGGVPNGGLTFGDTWVWGGSNVPTPTPTPVAEPRLMLDVGGPDELLVRNNRYVSNPFTLSAEVINNGTGTATDVSLSVDLPAGLSLDSSPAVVSVGDLGPGERRNVDWRLRADFQTEPITLFYTVLLRAGGTPVKTVPRQLKLPKLTTPVLIIPGVYGTELYKGSDQLWLDASKVFFSLSDDHLNPLVFNPDLQPLDTSVRTGAVIREVNVPLKRWDFDYTKSLIEELGIHGYREGEDQFTFPYDWRFGVSPEVVSELKGQIDYIRRQTGSPKVDVIAHSTGGLILKQYVKDYDDPGVGKAVFVGVPSTGAPKAVWVMLTGDTGLPHHSRDEMRKLARNMPIVYDLAPSRQYYSVAGSFFQLYRLAGSSSAAGQDLSFDDAYGQLATTYGMNSDAIARSAGVHSAGFDDYDLRGKNVEVYRIAGCKEPTIKKVVANVRPGQSIGPENFSPDYAPGDGTVPVESAMNLPVDSDKKYYALTGEHGTMLSQEGIKQEIVKLITGLPSIDPGDSITQDVSRCGLNGKAIEVHSPLDIAVTDQDGNFAVRLEDGTFLNTIPGAAFNSAGEHKFIFLPDDAGQAYDFSVAGTDTGTFTLEVKSIRNSRQTDAAIFPNLPVTTELRGELELNADQPELRLDTNGDGKLDAFVAPPVTLTEEQLRRREELNAAGATLAPPAAAPSTGTYSSTQSVSLIAPDWDMIYYTFDGSTPSCDGTGGSRLYTGPLAVVTSKSVKVVGCLAGGFGSQPAGFTYSISRNVPLLTPPPALTVSAGANDCGAFVGDSSLGQPAINDSWPDAVVSRAGVPAGNIFPFGQTTLTYTASDSQGNFAQVSQLVTVVDTSPPDLTNISADKSVLSPPNHKLVDVTVGYTARDNCGLVNTSITVTSNEPVNGTGDGDTAPDWQIVDDHHVRLRAERAGSGKGRDYTVTITATDAAGSSTRRSVIVAVPKGNLR